MIEEGANGAWRTKTLLKTRAQDFNQVALAILTVPPADEPLSWGLVGCDMRNHELASSQCKPTCNDMYCAEVIWGSE